MPVSGFVSRLCSRCSAARPGNHPEKSREENLNQFSQFVHDQINFFFFVLSLLKENLTVTLLGSLLIARITWLPASALLVHALRRLHKYYSYQG